MKEFSFVRSFDALVCYLKNRKNRAGKEASNA